MPHSRTSEGLRSCPRISSSVPVSVAAWTMKWKLSSEDGKQARRSLGPWGHHARAGPLTSDVIYGRKMASILFNYYLGFPVT